MSAPKTVLRVMGDLFGQAFAGPSWEPWRAALAALFWLRMTAEQIDIYRACTGRETLPTQPAREAWFIVGRRGGKSRIAALVAIFCACVRRYVLSPGEVGVVMLIAADRRQARIVLRYIVALLRSQPMLARLIVAERAEAVELSNGIVIEVHTASFRSTRGYTILALIADEIAFWPHEDAAEPDSEILAAVRPGMASVPNALLLAISSPYARRGELWKAHQAHYGRAGDPVLVWQAASHTMNPTLPADVVTRAYEEDPARAAAEYGAQFRADVESFVAREVVEAAVVAGRYELPYAEGTSYAAFVDPSGGSADSMTLGIAHRAGASAVLDAVREVRPPFNPDQVVRDCAALLRTYKVPKIVGDKYAGEWPRDRFREHGIEYSISDRTKSDIYREALPLLNSGKVELLDHARLAAQLTGLERRTARGGRDSIDHAPGAHDDLANAACGALVLAAAEAAPSLIRASDLLRDERQVPLPRFAQAVFATMIVGADGRAAIAYFASHDMGVDDPAPLTLVDVSVEPLVGSTVEAMFARLEELHRTIPRVRLHVAYVPRAYLQHVQLAGWDADEIPQEMLGDLSALALAAAGHVNAGRFKVATAAAEKQRSLPLGGALTCRPGERLDDDALRLAILVGIGLGLSPEAAFTQPAIQSARLASA